MSIIEKLETKYKQALELAYNLRFSSPSESDYYDFEAQQLLKKILLMDSDKNPQIILSII
ncbi:MAG: hypothetical protein CL868_17130 [Cytophagaceae bacterium]|nr:hypothetical protein [Cytophagaceae bacterium]|tara:strand:- start:5035 stop:5214 length:180 start_codon:yes stop_codon:yes gene_type:complete